MTQSKTNLFLKRLLVYCDGRAVYDEKFHSGVNIIRGENSTGKSTIADCIFYVLGGDLKEWKPEAEKCDCVMAEVRFGLVTLTIKREIASASAKPMQIFVGKIEAAIKSAAEGWNIFPYRHSEHKDSFSQYLFGLLGLPEIKTESESLLTMHQILRMLYVDQLTPADSLLRVEQFDQPLARKSIVDMLFGVYDDSLYQKEMLVREKRKQKDELSSQYKNIVGMFKESEVDLDVEAIEKEIAVCESRQKQVQEEIQRLLLDNTLGAKVNSEKGSIQIQNQYLLRKKELEILRSKMEALTLECEDSQQFLSDLERRRRAIDNSIITNETIGELNPVFCPRCLSRLDSVTKDTCALCKQTVRDGNAKSQYLRIRQELSFQIKESKRLLLDNEKTLFSLKAEAPRLEEGLKSLRLKLDESVSNIKTERDQRFDDLLIEKGNLESKTDALFVQRKTLQIIERFRSKALGLETEIKQLNAEISDKKQKLTEYLSESARMIGATTIAFVKRDLKNGRPREEAFFNPKEFALVPEKNTYRLDGRNQFSASSMTYLKNCAHFAILFVSLELDYFRYPRFILNDNIEDKGMQPERSHAFQKMIVEISDKYKGEHQIIFTTSMIAPELEGSKYCVGEHYTEQSKSLKF